MVLGVADELDGMDLVGVLTLEEIIDLDELVGGEADGNQGNLLDMIL